MDRTAYFEQRNERRAEKLADEKYQRDLARAKSGEMAAAHLEGQAAIGQSEDQKYQKSLERAQSGEMAAAYQQGLKAQGLLPEQKNPPPSGAGTTPPAALSAPEPDQVEAASPVTKEADLPAITYDDQPEARADGGDVEPGRPYWVGERGKELIVPSGAGTTPPAALSAPEPDQVEAASPVTTYDDQPEARADGGDVEPGRPYWVGERGKELIVPRKAGRVIPNEALPSGFRNTGAARTRNLVGSPTAPEATVQGHLIDERKTVGTNLAKVEAAKVTSEGNVEGHRITAAGHVEGARAAAEPNLIQANVIKTKADRERMAQFNSERDAEYNKILSSVDQNWPATVAKLEQKYREQNGVDMPPEVRGAILQADTKAKIEANKGIGTPEYGALLALGLPKEGEPVRPGQLIANGYKNQPDGSWQKEAVNQLSGSKYLDKFVPTAEGLTRREEMIKPVRDHGPGLYREEGRWYGSRASAAQQVPPKVLSIEQALNPKVIESYNQRAEKFNLPRIDQDLIQQNPGAAAWQVLTGVNQMNTAIGKGDPYDMRHLNAPTYVLNDADTKKAMEGHANWLNPSTAPPTAPAGTPPATTPDFIAAAREGAAAGAPGVAAVGPAPAPATEAAPAAAPTPAPAVPGEVSEDPAVENWKAIGRNLMAAGKVTADTLGGAVDLADRGAQNLVGLATRAATQTIPGAYKVFTPPTAENPMGLRPGEASEAPPAPATPTLAAAAPRFDERAGWGNSPQYPQREAPGPVPGVVTNRSVDAGVELPPEQPPRSLANVSPPQRFDERIGWSRPAPTPEALPAPAAPAAAPAVPERKLELIRPSAM
jgi:hypothetical protein